METEYSDILAQKVIEQVTDTFPLVTNHDITFSTFSSNGDQMHENMIFSEYRGYQFQPKVSITLNPKLLSE